MELHADIFLHNLHSQKASHIQAQVLYGNKVPFVMSIFLVALHVIVGAPLRVLASPTPSRLSLQWLPLAHKVGMGGHDSKPATQHGGHPLIKGKLNFLPCTYCNKFSNALKKFGKLNGLRRCFPPLLKACFSIVLL